MINDHVNTKKCQNSPSAKTFGLSRLDADTPKDFALTRFERDRSGISILRNTGVIFPNRNPAPVTKGRAHDALAAQCVEVIRSEQNPTVSAAAANQVSLLHRCLL